MQDPILEQVGQSLGTKVKIAKLNVDENPTTAQKFGVMSIPTLMVFKGGNVVKQFIGVQSRDTLVSELGRLAGA